MICPECGGAGRRRFAVHDRLFRTTDRRFEISACTACGLQFLWPQPAAQELPGFYPTGYWVGPSDRRPGAGQLAGWLERYRRAVLVDHVRFVGALVERQRATGEWRGLLDVGCGDGSFLEALGARPALGLDWSAEAVRAVAARGFPSLRGRLLATPLAPGSLSVVTMFHYLEHVTGAGDHLAAARRLLGPGGRLVVQVPNAAAWQCRLLRGRWGGYDPPRHLVNYDTQTLRRALERHGFRVRRTTHRSLRDNPTTLANSLAPGLYPPARLGRADRRTALDGLASLAYLGLVLVAMPLTSIEAALGRGAAVMMEAEPA
jgi:SAM-dependent methyltransferase